jgi:hypothetical protein
MLKTWSLSPVWLGAFVVACQAADPGAPDAFPGARPDASAPAPDAGATPTDEIVGGWRFTLGDPTSADALRCDVDVVAGGYHIVCPDPGLPWEVIPGCTQTRADHRIFGALSADFAGDFDYIEQYEGSGCAGYGVATGIPIVDTGYARMEASRTRPDDLGGILAKLDGDWSWSLFPRGAGEPAAACDLTFASGAFTVRCADGNPTWVALDCVETRSIVLEGALSLAGLTGAGREEARYDGAGCEAAGYPPIVTGDATPMSAARR